MAFEDEARRIGDDFLYLVPGNLREKSTYIFSKLGVRVPYSSYDNLWKSLVSQLGIVDTVRKILEKYMKVLPTESYRALIRASREPISTDEAEKHGLSGPVDWETGRASESGLFLLKYGKTVTQEIGRLSAFNVYQIGACINWLLQVRVSDKVIFEDGSAEKYGDRSVLGHLKHIERMLKEHGLARLEVERLQGLIDSFNKYNISSVLLLYDDHANLLRVVEKIESVVREEIMQRDFSELRPISGTLNYQKLPSEVLDGLLGDVIYSIPPMVSQDLEEAIKCLGFGAPTASVMVGLRAVEGWLRESHFSLTGQATRKGWAELLNEIQNLLSQKGVPTEPVAGFLNYVRNLRNTASHADKAFSQLEAEHALFTATNAIREIEKLK